MSIMTPQEPNNDQCCCFQQLSTVQWDLERLSTQLLELLTPLTQFFNSLNTRSARGAELDALIRIPEGGKL